MAEHPDPILKERENIRVLSDENSLMHGTKIYRRTFDTKNLYKYMYFICNTTFPLQSPCPLAFTQQKSADGETQHARK